MKYTVLLFGLVLAGCATSGLVRNSMLVSAGQTKQEVLDTLGTPKDRQFSGKNEAWQYCRTSFDLSPDDFVTVWFYDGQVTGVNTYKNTDIGMCDSFLREVKWEDAPDSTITIRHR